MKSKSSSSSSPGINKRKPTVLFWADLAISVVLILLLGLVILTFSRANIQTDSIDYYAIVQRLTQNEHNPIVRNLHFLEQRSPGYPLLSLLLYYPSSALVEPLVQTQRILPPSDLAEDPPDHGATE